VRFPETAYIRSAILLPVTTARRSYGILSIESTEADMYTAADERKLQPLADAAAIALEKAELYDELRSELDERLEAEERLEQSLRQKETLLREIHHRVKNNLAMVVSLINLQSSQIEDPAMKEVLAHIRSKIFSVSLIHEKLYRSHDLQHIELRDYAEELLETLRTTFAGEGDAVVDSRIEEDLVVDIERAIPLALIITELFTNSYKYVSGATCRITLRIGCEGEQGEMRFSDNGPGFPPDFSLEQSETLGLLLVRNLAGQLDGTAEVGDPRRAEICIRFPLRP
jgi:two-component sensor histidine kinase